MDVDTHCLRRNAGGAVAGLPAKNQAPVEWLAISSDRNPTRYYGDHYAVTAAPICAV